jgi:hypothetical protein
MNVVIPEPFAAYCERNPESILPLAVEVGPKTDIHVFFRAVQRRGLLLFRQK